MTERRFGRASRELDVPLTVACGMVMTAHPDSCTRALCAGAGIQVRRQTGKALERERYTRFANRLPGADMAGARRGSSARSNRLECSTSDGPMSGLR